MQLQQGWGLHAPGGDIEAGSAPPPRVAMTGRTRPEPLTAADQIAATYPVHIHQRSVVVGSRAAHSAHILNLDAVPSNGTLLREQADRPRSRALQHIQGTSTPDTASDTYPEPRLVVLSASKPLTHVQRSPSSIWSEHHAPVNLMGDSESVSPRSLTRTPTHDSPGLVPPRHPMAPSVVAARKGPSMLLVGSQ